MDNKNFISDKKRLPTGSISFFVLVILITIGLFFYNSQLTENNNEIKLKTEKIKSDIEEFSKDDKLQVFALIETNKTAIEELTKRTKITEYIKHLDAISKKYNLTFEGFKMSGGNVKTNAFVESSEDGGIAYVKTVDFIKNYRTDENGLFTLNFIKSIEGMDSMKFNVNFDIK